jgi:hypothetical protein
VVPMAVLPIPVAAISVTAIPIAIPTSTRMRDRL